MDLENMKPGEMVEEYVRLRDWKRAIEDKIKSQIHEPMGRLEVAMREFIQRNSLEGIKSKAGTAYVKTDVSVTIADPEAFREFVIGGGEFDLVDWRASKTVIRKLVEGDETKGVPPQVPPPGINYVTIAKIGVRKD